jgi:hypothetical protein
LFCIGTADETVHHVFASAGCVLIKDNAGRDLRVPTAEPPSHLEPDSWGATSGHLVRQWAADLTTHDGERPCASKALGIGRTSVSFGISIAGTLPVQRRCHINRQPVGNCRDVQNLRVMSIRGRVVGFLCQQSCHLPQLQDASRLADAGTHFNRSGKNGANNIETGRVRHPAQLPGQSPQLPQLGTAPLRLALDSCVGRGCDLASRGPSSASARHQGQVHSKSRPVRPSLTLSGTRTRSNDFLFSSRLCDSRVPNRDGCASQHYGRELNV